jgi:hypothetical protein
MPHPIAPYDRPGPPNSAQAVNHRPIGRPVNNAPLDSGLEIIDVVSITIQFR